MEKAIKVRDLSEHLAMLDKINEKYSEEQRMWKALEEFSELTLAIARYAQETDEIKKELHKEMAKGEIADSIIMLYHISQKFNIYEDVYQIVLYKIRRQQEREGL